MNTIALRTVVVCALGVVAMNVPWAIRVHAAEPGASFKSYITVIQTEEGKVLRLKLKEALASIEMIKVPGGSVELLPLDDKGQPRRDAAPVSVVVKPFWISKTELTWDHYDPWHYKSDLDDKEREAVSLAEQDLPKHARSRPSPKYGSSFDSWPHDGHPAILVHRRAVEFYCRWLSEMTGKKYRLPTEAEWEYACRGGANAEPFKTREELLEMGWTRENSMDEEINERRPQKAGARKPNAWGIHDMLGNVSEWVVGADGQLVAKGGSFLDRAKDIDSRARWTYTVDWQQRDPQDPKSAWWLSDGPHLGFRIIREE